MFSNQLHNIGINKYYDELKQVDLTFLFHSLASLGHWVNCHFLLINTCKVTPQSSCTSLRPLIELPTTLFSFMSIINAQFTFFEPPYGTGLPSEMKNINVAYHPSLQRWGHCISNEGLCPSKEGRRRWGPAAISH